jgi:hypothetical protein
LYDRGFFFPKDLLFFLEEKKFSPKTFFFSSQNKKFLKGFTVVVFWGGECFFFFQTEIFSLFVPFFSKDLLFFLQKKNSKNVF